MHDHNIITKLVDASGVTEGDVVVEVGPGTGALTEELLERGCEVIACELDQGLAGLLRDRFGDKIQLIHADCLQKKKLHHSIVELLGDREWKLVSNLPYQIASPLIVTILSEFTLCQGLYVTIQYEVAQRLRAEVDSKDWGVLSILVQRLADVQLITKVPNTCFWPQPKVTSACVSVVPLGSSVEQLKSQVEHAKEFSVFVTELFAKRRKQIGTIVGRDTKLPEGVSQEMRPSTLTIEQLEQLFKTVRTSGV